jgi:hypothetical protein
MLIPSVGKIPLTQHIGSPSHWSVVVKTVCISCSVISGLREEGRGMATWISRLQTVNVLIYISLEVLPTVGLCLDFLGYSSIVFGRRRGWTHERSYTLKEKLISLYLQFI